MVLFVQSCCIWAKVVVFDQKWLYSGKIGFIRAKVFALEQSGCIWAKVVVLGKSECIRQKWFNSVKDVVFKEKG